MRTNHRTRGSILLLVLVALVMMSLATGSYLVMMHNEHVATRYGGHHQQVRLLTESGIEYLRLFLAQTDELMVDQGGWQNNPAQFQGVLVADDALADFRGRFTVLAPDVVMGYYGAPRYGLENESSKVNLNTLVPRGGGGGGNSGGGGGADEDEARLRLMALPGMTDTIADAILDWLDADDVPRALGAEKSYYLSLEPAYTPRNGPITSLDELLMVRGVTSELLYGMDANRNFQVDANEIPRGALTLVDNYNGQMNRGWSAYLTLHSMERLETPAGERKINLNSRNLQQLYNQLVPAVGESVAKFIIVYRQNSDESGSGGRNGNQGGNENQGGEGDEGEGGPGRGNSNPPGQNPGAPPAQAASIESLTIDFQKEPQREIESLLDLVGAQVTVQPGGSQNNGQPANGPPNPTQPPAQIYSSPWTEEAGTYRGALLDAMDVVSTERGRRISGRVNINTSARPVLMSIPGMTDLIADQIISRRGADLDPITGYQRHAVWILADAIVTKDQMRELDPYVTAEGDVFTCQIVGFFEAAAPQARVEVVLDASGRNTRLSAWQDLGALGPGFAHTILWGGTTGGP